MKKIITSLALLLSLAGSAQTIELEPFASGFSSPVDIQNMGDERLFVVEQNGLIKIIAPDGTTNATNFLDISSQTNGGGEQGLLGLAFHPDYINNGYFYVNYTKNNGDTQISRFTVSTDPDVANAASELEILEYSQPFPNHNGGYLTFGPDGYLWIGTGDGGSGGDPQNFAQNLNSLLGKMLRIDVDNPSGGNNYGIPADNPYVGDPSGLDEIWAYGLRNPWKYNFDRETDELWIADVGQNAREEVNRVAATDINLNYGWRCYEGNNAFNTTGCAPQNTMTFPVGEYSHAGGNCSITGGYVYRGSEYPDLVGQFFFADICTGMINSIDQNNNLIDYGNFTGTWVTFGEDNNKNLYIASINGNIRKITSPLVGFEEFDTNSFNITPNPASQLINLSISNGAELASIEIYDIKGGLVHIDTDLKATEKTINVSSLKNGLYLVNVRTVNGSNISKKLIIR